MRDNLNITAGFLRSVEALLGTPELDALIADANGTHPLTAKVLAAAPNLIVVADKAPPSVEGRADQCIIRLGAIDDEPLVAPQPVAADDLA